MSVVLIEDTLHVSYNWLIEQGICRSVFSRWAYRGLYVPFKQDGSTYVPFDSIPAPSRKKLPSKEALFEALEAEREAKEAEARRIEAEALAEAEREAKRPFLKSLEYAFEHSYRDYLKVYADAGKRSVEYARLHAVGLKLLEHYETHLVNKRCKRLKDLYNAFCEVYPDRYTYKRFSAFIGELRSKEISAVVVDKRGGSAPVYGGLHRKWVLDALSSGKGYSVFHIEKYVSELCKENGLKTPSMRWIQDEMKRSEALVYKGRYGVDKERDNLPYAGIIRAEKVGEQWQIDGWRLPFYMKGFSTLTIFSVIDACSSKIVGYWIDRTENTETILQGIANAVENTGYLPLEIVSDNHSFNRTKEAEHFKEAVGRYGLRWTVSENPRYKSLVERSLGTFGAKYCKMLPGYIGEGIRTRRKTGRTAQELVDKWTKANAFLTEEQIKCIAIEAVEAYNTTANRAGVSPAKAYDSIGLGAICEVSAMERLQIFERRSEYLIRRGQINIERGGVKYEYQLSAEHYLDWNNKRVGVRYMHFDRIYLYDLKTDDFLFSVRRKEYAHGAFANQTAEDAHILAKHKWRLNGIQKEIERRQIAITKEACEIDPEAAFAMNAKITSKFTIEAFKENGRLMQEALRHGIAINEVPEYPQISEVTTLNEERKERKAKESPFALTEHKISVLKTSNNLN